MIKIKDNRLLFAGISVDIPNGLCWTIHPIYVNENIVTFCDEEETFYIELHLAENEGSIKNALKKEACRRKNKILTDVTPVSYNGLSGYYAIYEDETGYEFYEARIQNGKSTNQQHLIFLITVEKCLCDIHSVLDKKEVKRMLTGIKAE